MDKYRYTFETHDGALVDITVSAESWEAADSLAWAQSPDRSSMIAWEKVTPETIERLEDEPLMSPLALRGFAPTDDSYDDVHEIDARYRAGALYAYPISGDARLTSEAYA